VADPCRIVFVLLKKCISYRGRAAFVL
jgi:hypothetical protein